MCNKKGVFKPEPPTKRPGGPAPPPPGRSMVRDVKKAQYTVDLGRISYGKDFSTAGNFWDCECQVEDFNYIHRKYVTVYCSICGTHEKDQPDSRVNEVMDKFGMHRSYSCNFGNYDTNLLRSFLFGGEN